MKRSPELSELTREHHKALVLARRAIVSPRDGADARALAAALPRIFATELEPHFRVEEEALLPPLREAGEHAQVARLLEEHRQLRALAEACAQGEGAGLADFGALLEAHVRYEERQLFPLAEAVLPPAALAAVAARAAARPAVNSKQPT